MPWGGYRVAATALAASWAVSTIGTTIFSTPKSSSCWIRTGSLLGIRTTALKGDGFTAYLPDMNEFATIIDELTGQVLPQWDSEWLFHVSGEDIAGQVLAAGAQVATDVPGNYSFISLRAV